jgi:FkbM family methyltransferase
MGLLAKLEQAIADRRARSLGRLPGPIGAFFKSGGNRLLWSDLPLSSGSYLVDGGGYRGEWARELLWRYGCRCAIFEAIPEFASALSHDFAGNDRVEVLSGALVGQDGTVSMMVDADASRAVGSSGPGLQVKGTSLSSFLDSRALARVDCLKLNIEGAEFEVLEDLLHSGLMSRIGVLLVQFHRLGPDSDGRRASIRQRLTDTHREVFCFPWVWERWDNLTISVPTLRRTTT